MSFSLYFYASFHRSQIVQKCQIVKPGLFFSNKFTFDRMSKVKTEMRCVALLSYIKTKLIIYFELFNITAKSILLTGMSFNREAITVMVKICLNQARNWMGEWGGYSYPFLEIGKRYSAFGREGGGNAQIKAIYGLNFSFEVQFLKVSSRKHQRFFPAGPFFFVLLVIVCRSALIPGKVPCLKKFLVARLLNPGCCYKQFVVFFVRRKYQL